MNQRKRKRPITVMRAATVAWSDRGDDPKEAANGALSHDARVNVIEVVVGGGNDTMMMIPMRKIIQRSQILQKRVRIVVYIYLLKAHFVILRPCIRRLFPCGVCPCSLVMRHTENEPLFCLVAISICCTQKAKQRFIVCVACQKGTRAYTTRKQPMDTGPKMLFL